MEPHSSALAWKIPWMEEPGGLQSMGSLRVGHHGIFQARVLEWGAIAFSEEKKSGNQKGREQASQ